MAKIKDFQIAFLGLCLTVGMFGCAFVISDKFSRDNISVTGSAYEIVRSDSANWSFNINVKNSNKVAGFKAIKEAQPKIFEYLNSKGITNEQIDIQPLHFYETNKLTPSGVRTDEIAYYNFYQTYKVYSNDVEKIKELSTSISDLIEKGLDISSDNPEYQYSSMAELKIKLLEVATQDARARAKAMLKGNNDKVGKIRSVKMGVFQITPPTSNSVSDYGINDSSTIEKKVTAVANVVFAIK